jgi:hypothetical protein
MLHVLIDISQGFVTKEAWGYAKVIHEKERKLKKRKKKS